MILRNLVSICFVLIILTGCQEEKIKPVHLSKIRVDNSGSRPMPLDEKEGNRSQQESDHDGMMNTIRKIGG